MADYMCFQEQFPGSIFDCDHWLVTGSPSGVYEEHKPWVRRLNEFVRKILDLEKAGPRLIAFCYVRSRSCNETRC